MDNQSLKHNINRWVLSLHLKEYKLSASRTAATAGLSNMKPLCIWWSDRRCRGRRLWLVASCWWRESSCWSFFDGRLSRRPDDWPHRTPRLLVAEASTEESEPFRDHLDSPVYNIIHQVDVLHLGTTHNLISYGRRAFCCCCRCHEIEPPVVIV